VKLVPDCGRRAIGNVVAPASAANQKADNKRGECKRKDLEDTVESPHKFPVLIIGHMPRA
jgi:hypothetical protein